MWSQYSSWFGATPHIPLWFKAAALVIKWSTLAFVSNTRSHSNFHPCLKSVFGPFLLISITPCMSCKTLIINVAFKNFVFSSFPNFLSLPYLHFSRIHLPECLWFFGATSFLFARSYKSTPYTNLLDSFMNFFLAWCWLLFKIVPCKGHFTALSGLYEFRLLLIRNTTLSSLISVPKA